MRRITSKNSPFLILKGPEGSIELALDFRYSRSNAAVSSQDFHSYLFGHNGESITMSMKRVLICSCETILGAAIEEFLAMEQDLEVIGIPNLHIDQIISAVSTINPDIIILTEEIGSSSFEQIQQAALDFQGKSLIRMSSVNSCVEIFQEKKQLVPHAKDLLQIIRSEGKEGQGEKCL